MACLSNRLDCIAGAWRVLLTLSVSLSACGVLPEARPPPDAPPPAIALEIEAPDALQALLRRHLDLGRLNRLARGEAVSDPELERLVAAAPAQARALLDTQGYFDAEVRAERLGGAPPRVRVAVEPGPRATVQTVRMHAEGPLDADAAAGLAPALEAQRALGADWPLPPGAPFVDEDWSRAKRRSLAQLRAQGYVGAEWQRTEARVDAATQRVALSGTLASGPLYRVAPLNIEGLRHHDAQTVRNIADFAPGAPATEELLLDFQERLQMSGLFGRNTVLLAPNPQDPSRTPVDVRLDELRLQEATIGVGYSANVGPRLGVEHVHRRLLGRALTARNRIELARLEQAYDGEISTHTLPGLYRNLVGAAASRLESDTDVVTSARLRVGRAQETGRISRLVFAEAERSLTRSDAGRTRADALSLHYHGVWRDVDDKLLPTRGRVWTGQAGLGQARSDPGGRGPFARLYARLNAYRPLGDTWFAQGRIELGQVFAADRVLVPETMRFRAGGDESVRGYRYRSLTPRVDGVEVGGRVLFTASAEVARPILQRLPQLWGALFVDAGRAARRWSELDPAVGAGAGLRYRSPVGPVKLDFAWGEEERRLRLHLTVGASF